MHSNVTIKNVSWPHFSWATLYVQAKLHHLLPRQLTSFPYTLLLVRDRQAGDIFLKKLDGFNNTADHITKVKLMVMGNSNNSRVLANILKSQKFDAREVYVLQ